MATWHLQAADRRSFVMMVMVIIMLAINDVEEDDDDHNDADNWLYIGWFSTYI